MRILGLFIALMVAVPTMAQDLVLRVHATSVNVTDICSNCTATNLHTSYWTIYEAKVKDVVSGSFEKKSVRFAYAQHAQYTPRVLRNFVVILRPAPDWLRAQMRVDYEVIEVRFTGRGPNNSVKPTPHRGVGHVPALR
jgi:hypothetical protein